MKKTLWKKAMKENKKKNKTRVNMEEGDRF